MAATTAPAAKPHHTLASLQSPSILTPQAHRNGMSKAPPPLFPPLCSVVVLNDIHIDIMDYIVPATCQDVQFRSMWAEFEWENKVRPGAEGGGLRVWLSGEGQWARAEGMAGIAAGATQQ